MVVYRHNWRFVNGLMMTLCVLLQMVTTDKWTTSLRAVESTTVQSRYL